jgi:glycosyltransferase involved in cell wall biosynthesis
MALPRISVVTPSLNQGSFIEQTLRSIHTQDYPNLEHIVMDGGSTDNTIDILKNYGDKLFWQSNPDGGQYSAIEQGFGRATGEIFCWLNADDIYLPGALLTIGRIFRDLPEVEWLTTMSPLLIDEQGAIVYRGRFPGFSKKMFFKGDFTAGCGWPALGYIQQESTFWRSSLWKKVNGFPPHINYAGDFYLWNEFYNHADLFSVGMPLAGFRVRAGQKSGVFFDKYRAEALQILNIVPSSGWLSRSYRKFRMKVASSLGDSPRLIKKAKNLGMMSDTKYVRYNFEKQVFEVSPYPL